MLNTVKSLAKNNPNDFQNTPFGTTPSNYSREPHLQCQDVFYLSIRKKSKKFTTSSKNIRRGAPYENLGARTQLTSSLSKRKTESSGQYKTIDPSTNGPGETKTYPP